jgi:hypothetical protein
MHYMYILTMTLGATNLFMSIILEAPRALSKESWRSFGHPTPGEKHLERFVFNSIHLWSWQVRDSFSLFQPVTLGHKCLKSIF